ncbi:MAG: tRNA pseudouridine synthase A, partial [Clostridia bacterium]|nr:tRNA pseudouridine synthase A [Clostridia bacterium]
MKYLLVVSYDGTNFSGFQRQKKGERTIQEELEKTLKILLKQDINVVASGRTDSGVHAYNQVCNIECDEIADFYKFVRSMNGILPADVKVKSIKETKLHARFSAKRKTYLYKMYV